MKKVITLFALLLIGLALSCGNGTDNGAIVAQAGNARLTTRELREMVSRFDDLQLSNSQVENLVKNWLETEALYREALRLKLDRDPNIQRQIQKMAREYLVAQYVEKFIYADMAISAEEVEAYYQSNLEEFRCAEDEFHIKTILVTTLSEATEIRAQLMRGEDFSQWAQKRSVDGSRIHGGDMGFVRLGRLSPLLARALAQMRKGQLSLPIKSEIGYNLISLVDIRKKGDVLPQDDLRGTIEERILAQKKRPATRKPCIGCPKRWILKST